MCRSSLRPIARNAPRSSGTVDSEEKVSAWNLKKGDRILRKKLHDRFGGGRQGGISPSRKTPNIMIFSDHVVGREHGYADRKQGDFFLDVGEGQQGDQTMTHGNKAILNHVEDGRAIRLFNGCKGEVSYAGEFEIDLIEPFFTERAPSSGGGRERSVLVFRLREVRSQE